MRKIFLVSEDRRSGARKRMKTSALKPHENTMNQSHPRLLMAEIILHPNRQRSRERSAFCLAGSRCIRPCHAI